MATEKLKLLTSSDIKKHQVHGDLWLAIHGKVLNVSNFMDIHPGGADALMGLAGVDATSAFEDVGHSSDARALLEELVVGRAENLEYDNRTNSGDHMKLEQETYSILPRAIMGGLMTVLLLWYILNKL